MMADEKTASISGDMDGEQDDVDIPVPYKILTIDYSLYEDYRKNSDLSDGEWQETLDALWAIITGFVSLGFNVHPVQQACEQKAIPREFLTQNTSNLVSSDNSPKTEFKDKADGAKTPLQTRSQS